MERVENQSGQGTETPAARLHRMSTKENQVFGRGASLQTLSKIAHPLCVQNHSAQG
jgi:hypothetical protein